MKKIFLTAAVIAIALSSCELVKNATEVDFGSEYSLSYYIDLGENDTEINEVKTIDLSIDDEFEKYKEKLEEIKLDSVLISITGYVGPDACVVNGSLEYSDTTLSAGVVFSSITNLDIENLYSTASSAKIQVNESEIPNITNIMLNDQKIKVYLIGAASDTPVEFTFSVKFYTTIVAQALN